MHRRWHLWKRNYDVYTANPEGKKVQFAAMENAGFWWWTFTLRDERGQVLGVIDRDFRGLGLEVSYLKEPKLKRKEHIVTMPPVSFIAL